MISTAFIHAFRHDLATMESALEQLGSAAQPLLYLSAFLSLAAGAALILPPLVGTMPKLTVWAGGAAAGLVLISIPLHLAARDDPQVFVSILLFGLAVFLVYSCRPWISG